MEENTPRQQRGGKQGASKPQGGKNGGNAGRNSQNGTRRKSGGNNKTRSYKHVELEHERPQLSKSGQGAGKASGPGEQQERRSVPAPKRDPNAKLKIIPLGGLDAIGKNMTVFECKGDMIVDDAGLMFPDDNHPGIDLLLPDYTYILENAHKLRGIFITHGHEDHTGACPTSTRTSASTCPSTARA